MMSYHGSRTRRFMVEMDWRACDDFMLLCMNLLGEYNVVKKPVKRGECIELLVAYTKRALEIMNENMVSPTEFFNRKIKMIVEDGGDVE